MKKTFLFFISLAAGLSLFAQKNADWTKEFPSKINWYRITDAGTVMVATKDAYMVFLPMVKKRGRQTILRILRKKTWMCMTERPT